MLQETQRTSAPSSTSVSISTAVCTVMCSEPAIRAPFRGLDAANSRRVAIRPGISCSASRSWCRPASARFRSATANSRPFTFCNLLLMTSFPILALAYRHACTSTHVIDALVSWESGIRDGLLETEAPFRCQGKWPSVAEWSPLQRLSADSCRVSQAHRDAVKHGWHPSHLRSGVEVLRLG